MRPVERAPNPLPPWQLELADLPGDAPWDVAVVGAGPAGSLCALHLARGGHRVLLAERHPFPRDKACGDLLIPDSLDALRRAGLYEGVRGIARPLGGALVSSPSRVEWPIDGEFLLVKRMELDAALARAAADAGAVLVRGRTERIEVGEEPEGPVRVSFRGGAVARSRILVLATGADVTLSEALGMVRRKPPTAVALRAYLRAPDGPDRLLISFDRSILPGYGWVFPLANGQYNVGIGHLHRDDVADRPSLKPLLDRFLRSYPPARRMLDEGGSISAVRGARLRCGLEGTRPLARRRVLAIGESIGTTYPFTGEGMGKAMESGEAAAAVIRRALDSGHIEELEAYPRMLREELAPRYSGYRAAQTWFSLPFLNDLLARRARRSPYLRRKASEMVAETSDPREAISVRGVLRSLWS